MINDSNQSLNKPVMPINSPDSAKLLEDLMSQQEVKNPELAAKQARLIQKMRENLTNETPAA